MNQKNAAAVFGVVGLVLGSVLSLAGSASVRADETGHWETVKQEELKGVTPYGVFEILQRYPNEFEFATREVAHRTLAGMPTRTVRSVSVTLVKMEWKGPTTCAPGDPRLTSEGFGGTSLCWNEPDDEHHSCESMAVGIIASDPCAHVSKK